MCAGAYGMRGAQESRNDDRDPLKARPETTPVDPENCMKYNGLQRSFFLRQGLQHVYP
jgi:hypothetical protein